MNMQQCWNGMGMDDQGRIYIGFTSIRADGREDFPVFRFDPGTGEKVFLGTFLDVVEAAGNSQPGENIPKGHTRMIYANNKMYMGSQSFHDLKWEIDSLSTYRGSHLFAFDIAARTWQDLSASLPGGVITEHEGIISLNILPEQSLLVGLAHPSSDIVLYNFLTKQLLKVIPGIPWKIGNPLSREIIVAPSGNIYTYRGTEAVRQHHESHSVWAYNIHTGEMRDTGFQMTNGFWIGQTAKRDGSKIYINTTGGEIYEFDAATETFKDLGYELPSTDKRIIDYTYAITLSPDEKRIYYILSVIQNPGGVEGDGSGGSGELYYYDIATGQVVFVQQLPVGIYTSADLRDEENLYFSHFGSSSNLWSGNPGLFILHVGSQY
jgi:outer membrane protein assembly factor BamB